MAGVPVALRAGVALYLVPHSLAVREVRITPAGGCLRPAAVTAGRLFSAVGSGTVTNGRRPDYALQPSVSA